MTAFTVEVLTEHFVYNGSIPLITVMSIDSPQQQLQELSYCQQIARLLRTIR